MDTIKLAIIFTFSFFILGCSTIKMNGTLEPLDAVKVCSEYAGYTDFQMCPQNKVSFDSSVHYSATTDIMAKFCKLLVTTELHNDCIAFSMIAGYYSNYPDLDKNYEAVSQFLPLNGFDHRRRVFRGLHSLDWLNNNEIIEKRERIKTAMREALTSFAKNHEYRDSSAIKFGLYLHALADTYAHTDGYYGNGAGYNSYIGHGLYDIANPALKLFKLEPSSPDDISGIRQRTNLTAYLNELSQFMEKNIVLFSGVKCDLSNCIRHTYMKIGNYKISDRYLKTGEVDSQKDRFEACMMGNSRPASILEFNNATSRIMSR